MLTGALPPMAAPATGLYGGINRLRECGAWQVHDRERQGIEQRREAAIQPVPQDLLANGRQTNAEVVTNASHYLIGRQKATMGQT